MGNWSFKRAAKRHNCAVGWWIAEVSLLSADAHLTTIPSSTLRQANQQAQRECASSERASMSENAERAVRYLHEATQEEGESGKKGFSCRWFLDRSFYCVTPGNQMTHYYRYGTADECKGTWKNMYNCLRASMMDEEKRAVRATCSLCFAAMENDAN
ncbi:Beta-glucosidase btge, partial [Globisporangium splendens]